MNSANKISSIDEIIEYYNQNLKTPLLVAETAEHDKHCQILNEARNFIEHLVRTKNNINIQENAEKSKNHIDRASLDGIKIIWAKHKERAEETINYYSPKEYHLVKYSVPQMRLHYIYSWVNYLAN